MIPYRCQDARSHWKYPVQHDWRKPIFWEHVHDMKPLQYQLRIHLDAEILDHHHKKKPDHSSKQGHQVVVVQLGSQLVAFVVDGLIGQEEVVIKPLDGLLQGTPGMSGATITSDGGIALILDVPSLLDAYAKKSNEFLAAMKLKEKAK